MRNTKLMMRYFSFVIMTLCDSQSASVSVRKERLSITRIVFLFLILKFLFLMIISV